MCWDCFTQYTDAPVLNERVHVVYNLIAAQKGAAEYSPLLHCIVADMNLNDDDFSFDAGDAGWLREHYDATEPWERDIFDGLKALSEPERATAVAMHWGYISPSGELRADLVDAKAIGGEAIYAVDDEDQSDDPGWEEPI